MDIPQNININHLLKAIEKIDIEGIPTDGESRYYDVLYKEKRYPPKVVVSFANLFANGVILDRNKFEGGLGTVCFKLLEQEGFKIVKKMEKIEKYLSEFKIESDDWFAKTTWLLPRYEFFKSFFEKSNLQKAEWPDFQNVGNNLHCFITNPLAKANAFGRANDSIEYYRKNFEYLVRGSDPVNVRLNNLNNKTSNHKIRYISNSSLSELVGYAYPEDYVFYNSRSKKALRFLDIKLPSNKGLQFGDEFISFNETIKPIIEAYTKIVGKRTNTTIPLEVDQFFSWLCELKIKPTEEKFEFFPILKKFIDQAQTDDQKYSSYPKTYKDFDLDIKFGQGVVSHVPYLAILKKPNRVPDGIYPVYLFYKKQNTIILSYGVSETNTTQASWPNDSQKQTILDWYLNEFKEKPFRYGTSYVKSIYNISDELDPQLIQNDLDEILEEYQKIDFNIQLGVSAVSNSGNIYKDFYKSKKDCGLVFSEKFILRFIASLCTKPFVICSGLSGSGKTKLAQAFAVWICESESQYCIVPVGADWTNREPLLGFPNALKEDHYVKPENRALDLIIAANNDKGKPYFLILDEMNLSHVERYFADFLSVMESKGKIALHPGSENWNNVPSEIQIPPNLFIIGTVNIDETTYMFSPKVLDRANVIEFSVTDVEMENYLLSSSKIGLDSLEGKGVNAASFFLDISINNNLLAVNAGEVKESLLKFFGELKRNKAEFGFRTASEILRFVAVINRLEPDWSTSDIIDVAIVQKLLPKVHGSKRKLEPILKSLAELCLKEGHKFDDYLKSQSEGIVKYPISLNKIIRMYDNLLSNGFTSYAEA